MPAARPLRLYKHVFVHGPLLQDPPPEKLEFVRSGNTPCRAKSAAFVALEEKLKVDLTLPRSGWWLAGQVDVTHLAVRG
jgi:hypothetical protein